MAPTTKRTYRRRSEAERIVELEQRIKDIKTKLEAKGRQDSPVLKQIPKLQTRLRKFAQLSMECGRPDVSNTTIAFVAGLDRILNPDQQALRDWNAAAEREEAM
jgi:hypothetical protein